MRKSLAPEHKLSFSHSALKFQNGELKRPSGAVGHTGTGARNARAHAANSTRRRTPALRPRLPSLMTGGGTLLASHSDRDAEGWDAARGSRVTINPNPSSARRSRFLVVSAERLASFIRKRFGESPRETLSRSRKRGASFRPALERKVRRCERIATPFSPEAR